VLTISDNHSLKKSTQCGSQRLRNGLIPDTRSYGLLYIFFKRSGFAT
jgi:hypothetical protein